MNWLKELYLILIIGSWAVFAADTAKNNEDTPRVITEEGVKFLVNPLDFLNGKNPTSKPTKIVIKPAYPEYSYSYPSYPYPTHPYPPPYYYPDYPHNPPHYPYPTAPPRRPNHSKPSHEHHYSHPPPPPHQSHYGYYPIHQDHKKFPILLVYGPDRHQPSGHYNHKYENWNDEYFNDDGRFFVNNVNYPLAENAQEIDEELEDNQTDLQYRENDGRDSKLGGISLINDSAEDSDALAIDSHHIKLPFDIQLTSQKAPASTKSDKKLKHQEALVYLKNIKKGRKLERD